MDLIEAIRERRSVRSYDGRPVSEEVRKTLVDFIDKTDSPFGGSVTIRLKSFDLKDGYKPSTYGFIKGAVDYFLIAMGSDEESALSAGFRFEQVVLRAWQLGLGTCWIAGTFKGQEFDRGQTWPEGETLQMVSPVGIAARKGLFEKIARAAMGSSGRKPFESLFFARDFSNPLGADNSFAMSLEMMRLAPSSTNSQPWRAVVEGNTVHFYCRYRSMTSIVDCGIGMCHFSEAEEYAGRSGRFHKDPDAPAAPKDLRYIYSYTANS